MNPTGLTPPPSVRRSQLTTLFMLGSLAVIFLWFFSQQRQQLQYAELIQKGSAALAKKDVVHARGFFDAVLRANPTTPLLYNGISSLCVDLDQPALALEYAQRGLDTCKDAKPAQRSDLYIALSQAQVAAEPAHPQTKAIASVRAALRLDPSNTSLKNALGYLLADNDQNLEEAERLLREALQSLQSPGRDPDSDSLRPGVEDSFGWLLYKKGDYVGAVAQLSQATQDLPDGVSGYAAKYYYYHLGAAYRKAGKPDDARRTLAIALQYDPDFPEAKAEVALLPPVNTPAVVPAPVNSPSSSVPLPSAPGLKL
ncbi:MAG: hypothetical protein JWN14_560 [Chthonomonadales bacterium]|nr:hypothetical protein [Chthonomonadales bacterium]